MKMNVRELAAEYAAMLAGGQMDAAAMKHWSDDIATFEAQPGEMAETHGKAEAIGKAEAWYAAHDVHGFRAEGPFINGDSFLMILDIDVTPKGGERMQMREVVSYKVADGKVVEERYFY